MPGDDVNVPLSAQGGGIALEEELRAIGSGRDEVPQSSALFSDFEEAIRISLSIEQTYRHQKFSQTATNLIKPSIDRLMDLFRGMIATGLRLERRNAVLEAESFERVTSQEQWTQVSEKLDRLESSIRVASEPMSREMLGGTGVGRMVSYPVPAPRRKPLFSDVLRSETNQGGSACLAVVRALDSSEPSTADDIKDRLIREVKPVEKGWQVVNLRKKGRDRVEIQTATPEALQRVLKDTQLKDCGLKAAPIGGHLPQVVVYDVPSKLDNGSILKAIKAQNFSGEKQLEDDKWEVSHRTGPKDRERTNVVIRVQPSMRERLLAKGRLFIEWNSCRVDDYVGVTRCFRCHRYGHVAKLCKLDEKDAVCSHCAESGHVYKVCPNKSKDPKCGACKAYGLGHDHDIRSAECPTYVRAFQRKVSLTNYG